jgi:hypothetical protein
MRTRSFSVIGIAAALIAVSNAGAQRDDRAASSQAPRVPHGWELSGVPALNFDADEGFGVGAALELYNYGLGIQPYRFTIQPTLLFTSEGRRDITAFFDAPRLLPGGWRMSAFVGSERQLAQPYYGVGNETVYNEANELPPNPYFYRYGRSRLRASVDFQQPVWNTQEVRLLFGIGVARTSFDVTPHDSGTTLLALENSGQTPATVKANYVRVGFILDTRDQEIGPHSGTWAELLMQDVTKAVGANEEFSRFTATVRQYVPLGSRLTVAERVTAQQVTGSPSFDELSTIQSSFKQQEGLGGSSSIRGVPKDRYIGKAVFLTNSELRWHALDFSLFERRSFLALSAFADAGRVWSGSFNTATMFSDLHVGYGGGVRVGVGPSFIVATDVGHSSESTAAVYIGLGWMY